ncbi:MAG: hypothetical protein ACK4VI_04990 [Alphaproteobacteria bacterium]
MKRKYRHILGLCALVGVIALTGFAAKDANASVPSFSPVAAWDVSKMSASGAGEQRCLMMTEYNNGFFVQIQGKGGKIEALSIDFRQKAFEVGQRLAVEISVPGQNTAQLQARAFKPEILVVNFNNQDGFFNTMRSANAFDIKISGNTFRFFLTGFANTLAAFDSCINARPSAAAPSAPQAMIEDTLTPGPAFMAESAPSPAAQQVSAPSRAQNSPNQPIENLQGDDLVDALRDFIGDGSPEMPAQQVQQPQQATFEAPVETVMTPEPVVERYVTPEASVTTQSASGEFDFTNVREVSSAPAVPPQFSDSTAGGAGGTAIRNEMSELRKELEVLRAQKENLDAELKLALRASERERLEVSSNNWNLETATMRFNEAERQITSLGQQIQKERAQCAFEKKELEMMLFDPNVTEQAQLARLASLEQQLEAARAEIERLKAGQ